MMQQKLAQSGQKTENSNSDWRENWRDSKLAKVFRQYERSKRLTMASLKITVPSGGKDSLAYKDVLKVSIAASAYNTPVQWVKGTCIQNLLISGAEGKVTLENKKAKLTLTDANAIVLYCSKRSPDLGICMRRRGNSRQNGQSSQYLNGSPIYSPQRMPL